MPAFRLQSVLNYRKVIEDKKQQELARLQKMEKETVNALKKEEQDLAFLSEEKQSMQEQGVSVQDLLLYESRIEFKKQRLFRIEKQIEKLRRQIEQQKAELLQASRDKKALENLKDSELQREFYRIKKEETAALDEVAVLYHRR